MLSNLPRRKLLLGAGAEAAAVAAAASEDAGMMGQYVAV